MGYWKLRKSAIAIIVGMCLALAVSGIASAQSGLEHRGLSPRAQSDEPPVSLTYAYVLTNNVPVYASPIAPGSLEALNPVRSLGAGYLWVSLHSTQPIVDNGRTWYRINANEYVQADQIAIYRPSQFKGVALAAHPEHAFAWMVYPAQPSLRPGEAPAADTPWVGRYTQVTIYEEQKVGDWWWYRIGPYQWVEQRKVGMVRPAPRPEGVAPGEKWIEVNLYEQTLAAYEGDRLVYATLVSSGLPYWKTEAGLFRVWSKVKQAKMSGREGFDDYYFLEDVPWTTYFNGAFALHGAYWHDRFGFPHSHGCVNLAPGDAKWVFDWVTPTTGLTNWTLSTADTPGTWVWVHD
jgi:hypothetical protein